MKLREAIGDMPLKIEKIDDRTFKGLVEEAMALLPRYSPEWTNHNPSDPGVTLIELLAYFTEIYIFRLDRVTRETKVRFLTLLRSVKSKEVASLSNPDTPISEVDDAIRKSVLALMEPKRAVIPGDYEILARKVMVPGKGGRGGIRVSRAACFSRTDLSVDGVGPPPDSPGHVSVVIVPERLPPSVNTDPFSGEAGMVGEAERPPTERPGQVSGKLGPEAESPVHRPGPIRGGSDEVETPSTEGPAHFSDKIVPKTELSAGEIKALLVQVADVLAPKRLLATRVHVVPPCYLRVGLGAAIRIREDALFPEVQEMAIERLTRYFSPLPDAGTGEGGWPFGRPIYLSEVYEQLEQVAGVEYIQDIRFLSISVGQELREPEGNMLGIQIGIPQTATLGETSLIGGAHSAGGERLLRDGLGRLMAVALRPFELVKIAVEKKDLLEYRL